MARLIPITMYSDFRKILKAAFNTGTVIVLDLGFSKESKSCGLAVARSGDERSQYQLQFSQAVVEVKKATLPNSKNPVLLLIEAPLSEAYSEDENPAFRRGLKDVSHIEWSEGAREHDCDNDKTIGWYHSPGVGVHFAVGIFLGRLIKKFRGVSKKIYLVEVLCANKPDNSVCDSCEAAYILKQLSSFNKKSKKN